MQVDKNQSFDQFSHDLTLALEETSRGGAGTRWGLRRRTRSTGNLRNKTIKFIDSRVRLNFILACPPQPTSMSDSSSTDPNDPLNDNNNNDQFASGAANSNSILSDSDDRHSYAFAFKLRQTPMSGNFESDSLNENFSPSRPNIRRKRKFKRMAVEYETTPSTPHTTSHPIFPINTGTAKKRVLKHTHENFRSNLFFGKRKRPHRERYADYESYKHSSSVPRQRGGFLSQKDGGLSYLEYKSRNRASSMSTARGPAIEKILPLNKSIISKIEKIAQDQQSKMSFNFTSMTTLQPVGPISFHIDNSVPVVHFQSLFSREPFRSPVVSQMDTSVNVTDEAKINLQKMAQKSGSFESALPTNNNSANKLEHKKKMKHYPPGYHVPTTGIHSKHKQSRRLKLQFEDQNFMDCGNINDFLSSSSLSSSDSEAEETNESDHEGDDELTDWPGHEVMVNFASKNEFKRANKKTSKLPQIKQQDDIVQDDDTLMSADEIQGPTVVNSSQQMFNSLEMDESHVPSKVNTSHPINIVGAMGNNFVPVDGSSTSGVVADGGYGSSFATSYNHKQPVESEMSGETSNHFLSSPNTCIGEIREIRAGCRRIREERRGFSIITSFNEDLLKYVCVFTS